MACRDEWDAVEEAERLYGRDSAAYTAAYRAWTACLLTELAMHEGREGHAAAWDERLIEIAQFLRDAWEALFGMLKPLPRPGDPRTLELRAQVTAKPETAMLFSQSIQGAIKDAGISLMEDETFACLMFVIPRPTYASQLIADARIGADGKALPRVHAILEPDIMQQVMEAVARDKVK